MPLHWKEIDKVFDSLSPDVVKRITDLKKQYPLRVTRGIPYTEQEQKSLDDFKKENPYSIVTLETKHPKDQDEKSQLNNLIKKIVSKHPNTKVVINADSLEPRDENARRKLESLVNNLKNKYPDKNIHIFIKEFGSRSTFEVWRLNEKSSVLLTIRRCDPNLQHQREEFNNLLNKLTKKYHLIKE